MLTDHTEPVQTLLQQLTPDIDPARLVNSAQRYEDLAQCLSELQIAMDGAVRMVSDTLAGHTSQAVSARAQTLISRELATAVNQLQATAGIVRAYAEAVDITQQRLTVVAAIADRDLLAARVMGAAGGATTAEVGAEQTAARVMTAAAGELNSRTEQIVDDATDRPGSDPVSHTPGMGAPMVPGAMMAPMGAALAGFAARRTGNDIAFDTDLPLAEVGMLRGRAAMLAGSAPPEVAPWIRLAVGLGQDGDGRRVVVVGTNEPNGYLRPGVVPEPHEVVVGDGRAPELAIIGYFADRDLTPLAVCATTTMSPEVAALVGQSGAATIASADDDDNAPEPGP